jgi:hypothetical protein
LLDLLVALPAISAEQELEQARLPPLDRIGLGQNDRCIGALGKYHAGPSGRRSGYQGGNDKTGGFQCDTQTAAPFSESILTSFPAKWDQF